MRENVVDEIMKMEDFNWSSFKSGSEYALSIYLPGCSEQDLHVEIDAGRIDVYCVRPQHYARVFPFPDDWNIPEVRSSYSNGILTLRISTKKTAAENVTAVQDDSSTIFENTLSPMFQMAMGN